MMMFFAALIAIAALMFIFQNNAGVDANDQSPDHTKTAPPDSAPEVRIQQYPVRRLHGPREKQVEIITATDVDELVKETWGTYLFSDASLFARRPEGYSLVEWGLLIQIQTEGLVAREAWWYAIDGLVSDDDEYQRVSALPPAERADIDNDENEMFINSVCKIENDPGQMTLIYSRAHNKWRDIGVLPENTAKRIRSGSISPENYRFEVVEARLGDEDNFKARFTINLLAPTG